MIFDYDSCGVRMKRAVVLGGFAFLAASIVFSSCRGNDQTQKGPKLYSIGIFQITDAPTLNEARKGVIQALLDSGLRDGVNVRLVVRNAMGDVAEAQRIAREFVKQRMDLIIALSTQCLQAALMAAPKAPVIFASVANPHLLGVGKSASNHSPNVTGVASTGPVKQTVSFIHEVLPRARRIGTLWTPSELNSEYYLQLLREGAEEWGLEVVAVPVGSVNEVLPAAQTLLNRKIDVLFPISDNTINASFETLGRLAEQNGIPLFGGFPLFTRLGACAALGWDFFEMGYKTGQIAVRVKNGEPPGRIPLQSMTEIRLHLNLAAARKQGVDFPLQVIERADEVIGPESAPGGESGDRGSGPKSNGIGAL
jgi:putative ABC transport system substrate-binding protein